MRVLALALGPDGSVYVGDNGTRTVRVFSDEGDFEAELGGRGPREVTAIEGFYLGEVVLPRRFRAEAVDGPFVVGVWMDDLDVEYVLRFEAVPR